MTQVHIGMWVLGPATDPTCMSGQVKHKPTHQALPPQGSLVLISGRFQAQPARYAYIWDYHTWNG